MISHRHLLPGFACLLAVSVTHGDEPAAKVSDAKKEGSFLVHTVTSPYQDKPTTLQVLLPSKFHKDKRYPVLYVLPVEAGDGNRYGNGLREIEKQRLHDKHDLICVMPTFARLPWYADHPTNPQIRQETHLLKVIIPFVEEKYPAIARSEGRLLLGFSKSGWGAFTLLLRHPDTFGKAAAWDAPLDMDAPGKYGSGDIFATRENFEKYRVFRLFEDRVGKLGDGTRLAFFGYGSFRPAHETAHARLDRLKVAHEYRDGPPRKHDWHSGWVPEAVAFLVKPIRAK